MQLNLSTSQENSSLTLFQEPATNLFNRGRSFFHGHRPLALGAPFGLTSCRNRIPARELFCLLPQHRERPSKRFRWGMEEEVFLPVIRLQGFSWYDFVSFDNSSSAKLGQFYRRIRGWGEFLKVALLFFLRRVSKENRARGSVCGSKNDITEVLVVRGTTV